MGDLVRHAAEQEALGPAHALVADDDDVGADLSGDGDDRVAGSLSTAWVSTFRPLLRAVAAALLEDGVDLRAVSTYQCSASVPTLIGAALER